MIVYQAVADAPTTTVCLGQLPTDKPDYPTRMVGSTSGSGFNINESIARLLRFYHLKDDWDGDASPAPSDESICLAISLLMNHQFLLKTASVFPSFEGGILVEWRKSGWGYSLLVLNNGQIEFFGIEIDGSDELNEITVANEELEQLMARIITLPHKSS